MGSGKPLSASFGVVIVSAALLVSLGATSLGAQDAPPERAEPVLAEQPLRPWPAAANLALPTATLTAEPDLVAARLGETERDRNDAMINGALIAVGALGIADNVISHWILGLHRAIEDSPYTLHVEIGIVAVSTAMVVTGLLRERRARRR